MKYSELEQVLKDTDNDILTKIFDKYFNFNSNIIIDQLDNYNKSDLDDIYEDVTKFGCIIKNNNIIVPAGLQFRIYKNNNQDPSLFNIERNGISFSINYLDNDEDIEVTFTKFGQNLFNFAKKSYMNISQAYDIIKDIEDIFKVIIIK